MKNPGIIMHDGNFGADWVNIMRGPQLIAKVPYMPDGSQRDVARRIVWAWNNIDHFAAPHVGHTARKVSPDHRVSMIASLAERLRDVRERVEPGMLPEDVARLLVDINNTLHMVK